MNHLCPDMEIGLRLGFRGILDWIEHQKEEAYRLAEKEEEYFQRDTAAGILTDEEAVWIIASLFLNDTHYAQIGGLTPVGEREVTSIISIIILDAMHLLHIPTTEGFALNGFPEELGRMRIKCGCNWTAIPGMFSHGDVYAYGQNLEATPNGRLRGEAISHCSKPDPMAMWGKLAAIKLGIPLMSSTTTFAFNRYSAKIMKQDISQLFSMLFAVPKANRFIKKLRDKGYPVKNVLSIVRNDNDTNTIVYTSPEFQPCADTFSDKYTFVGPSIRAVERESVKRQRKRIYISMGTVNNMKMDFYKKCIAALKHADLDVVMSVGESVSPEGIAAAIQKVLNNTSYQRCAEEISSGFKRCGGYALAADKIEHLII